MKTGSAYARLRAGQRLIREGYELDLLMERLLRYGVRESIVGSVRDARNTLMAVGGILVDEAFAKKLDRSKSGKSAEEDQS